MFSESLGSVIRVLRLFGNVDFLCALSSVKPNQRQKDPFRISHLNANLVVALISQTLQGII